MKAKKPKDQILLMDAIDTRTTELGFVTSINNLTRTFFVQLCKFSNIDLIQFNQTINNFCNGELAKPITDKKVRKGTLVCAKFSRDGFWYRALVIGRDEKKQTYQVLFIDYGNLETSQLKDMVQINSSDLPEIERVPFGISCFLKDSDTFPDTKSDKLLESLSQNYVMIRILERQTKLQWMVEIPKNAYNRPFWTAFSPEIFNEKLAASQSFRSGLQNETEVEENHKAIPEHEPEPEPETGGKK